MYKIYDKECKLIARFNDLQYAREYAAMKPGSMLISNKSTPNQRKAVRWCESVFKAVLNPQPFKGNIELFDECDIYLSTYLGEANILWDEALSSYDYEKYD